MRSLSVFTVLLLAFSNSTAHAQRPISRGSGPGTVRGVVVAAEGNQPLASARVALRSAADSTIARRGTTDAAGRFQVINLPVGRYRVTVLLTGFAPLARDVTLTAVAPVVDLSTLALAANVFALEGISVEVERSAVTVAPDRTAYSTRDMPVASGGSATDVLRSVPELEVDIEGSVSLRGTAAQIYLNGRAAPMSGEALEQFLQQFPADRIDRVEVIANPSARFDAEGAGGIVNIVLKRNVDLGLSGSLFTNSSTRGDLGGGGRLAYQRGRVTVFGGSFLRLGNRNGTSYDLRRNLLTTPITSLEQNGWSDTDRFSANVDLTAEWKLTERSTLWGEVGVNQFDSGSEGITEYTLTDALLTPLERYDRFVDRDSDRFNRDLGAGFRYVVQPSRHHFSFELRQETGVDDDASLIRRLIFAPDGGEGAILEELSRDRTDEDERELTLEADYVRPWGATGQFELGYRGDRDETERDRNVERLDAPSTTSAGRVVRTAFAHRESAHSAYLIATQKFGKLGVQAGARAEQATSRFELQTIGESFEKEYASLFPSANLTYDVGEGVQSRLSYTRRIRRPDSRVLNPLNRSSDPLNRYIGNPDIDPQYTHSLSLETSWAGSAGSLRFSPYYRKTVDDWAEIKTVDAEGVSTVTWENLASVDSYGTSLTASLRPVGGWGGYLSLSGHRELRDASNLSLAYSGTSFRWSARGNVSGRLTGALSAQGMFFYMPGRDVPQGRISSRFMTHVGVRQQLWNEKATVSLMVTDPFDLSNSSFTTRDLTHEQTGRSSWSARSAVLSFSYAFGRPPRNRQGQNPEEPEAEEPTIR